MSRFIDALADVNPVLLIVTIAACFAASRTWWKNRLEERRKDPEETSRLG